MMDSLLTNRLLICVGAGGVGKTSMAATIGLRAAITGKKVLVLTIDPAKRLANSLGLSAFGNAETQIDISGLNAKGELWAMMLDGKQAFYDLIERIAQNEAHRDSIFGNNIFKSIADTIVGNQEYMATEKLYDVMVSERYDLVVLDTPPVKNALDFLDSPGRMARFVDKRIMKWFLEPSEKPGFLNRVVSTASSAVFKLLSHVFGEHFLNDIVVFFHNFRELYEGFQERHQAVEAIFRAADTCFLIVAAPNKSALSVADFFLEELKKRDLLVPAVIINQRHQTGTEAIDAQHVIQHALISDDFETDLVRSLAARLGAAHRRLQRLEQAESQLVEILHGKLDSHQQVYSVPRLHGEVHDLTALNRVGALLFNPSDHT
ncbi:MAG: ArsA-related P-loop ATPase [Myxococcota bacterium]|nr:ArsA-related P-loop ATPase [Myxococcota bacterium]